MLICLSAAANAREYRLKAQQSWVAAGLNGLSQRIQGDHRLEDLASLSHSNTRSTCAPPWGHAWPTAMARSPPFGGYALPRERLEQRLLFGEGLVARPRVRARCCMCAMPAGHLMVSSSTGQASAAELLLAPAGNGEVLPSSNLASTPADGAERTLMERARHCWRWRSALASTATAWKPCWKKPAPVRRAANPARRTA